jgi:hypothetical protein
MASDSSAALRPIVRRVALTIGPLRRLWSHRNRLLTEVEDLTRGAAELVTERARAVAAVQAELLTQAENHDRALADLMAERDRSLAGLQAELAVARDEAMRSLRKAEYCEQRLEALRDQRDSVAASALALVARTTANGSYSVLFLQTEGSRRTAVYPLADGVLSLSPLTGQAPHAVCLITQPKAGTYLVAKLLVKLGLVNTEVHVDRLGFSDYRHKSIVEMQADYLKFTTHIPIEVSAGLTATGQFIVGHLEYEPHSIAATRHLRRILLIRNARDCLVSCMRFFEIPGRAETKPKIWMTMSEGPDRLQAFLDQWGADLIPYMRGVLGWMKEPDVLVVRFEELMGDMGPGIQRRTLEAIAQQVGVSTSQDLVSLFARDVVGKPTKTYSGARSETRRYWDEQVEMRFVRLGGDALQRDLGYSEVWRETAHVAD